MRAKKVQYASQHFTLAGDNIAAVAIGCNAIVYAPRATSRLARVAKAADDNDILLGYANDGLRRAKERVVAVGHRRAKKDFVRFANEARRNILRRRDRS